jgi:hypothetical protein
MINSIEELTDYISAIVPTEVNVTAQWHADPEGVENEPCIVVCWDLIYGEGTMQKACAVSFPEGFPKSEKDIFPCARKAAETFLEVLGDYYDNQQQ